MKALTPRDETDCLEIIQTALASGHTLDIQGSGTKRSIGFPVQAAKTVDLSKMSGISLYEPEELVMTAGPGTPLAKITKAVNAKNQELAFEPPDYGPLFGLPAGKATIGGILAGNLAGPRRLKVGAARDHFLGVRAVSGRGEAFKSGGRVVKNVTGYDLCKGLTGSWGTLAVMTEVTVKVLPAGAETRTVLVAGLNDKDAARAMATAMGSAYEVSGAAHVPSAISADLDIKSLAAISDAATAIRVEGIKASVEYRAEGLIEALKAFGDCVALKTQDSKALWRAIGDGRPFTINTDRPLWRISTAPMSGPDIAAHIGHETNPRLLYDWAGGLLWVELPKSVKNAGADVVRGAVNIFGGHATLFRASETLRKRVDVFQPQEPALANISRKLKLAFDPDNILNPGRMYRAA